METRPELKGYRSVISDPEIVTAGLSFVRETEVSKIDFQTEKRKGGHARTTNVFVSFSYETKPNGHFATKIPVIICMQKQTTCNAVKYPKLPVHVFHYSCWSISRAGHPEQHQKCCSRRQRLTSADYDATREMHSFAHPAASTPRIKDVPLFLRSTSPASVSFAHWILAEALLLLSSILSVIYSPT